MGKASKARRSAVPPESVLRLAAHPALAAAPVEIVDTHTHLHSTYEAYRAAYPGGAHADVYALARALYAGAGVRAVVDVWCEAPVLGAWRAFADSDAWGEMAYYFVMGAYMCVCGGGSGAH
jgi:TatD DNase family protein